MHAERAETVETPRRDRVRIGGGGGENHRIAHSKATEIISLEALKREEVKKKNGLVLIFPPLLKI